MNLCRKNLSVGTNCWVGIATTGCYHLPVMGKKGALNSWRTDEGEYSRKFVKRCDKNRYRNESIKHRHHMNHHNYGDNMTSRDAIDEAEIDNTNVVSTETNVDAPSDRRSALKLERKIQRQRKHALGKFYYEFEDDIAVDSITKQLPVSLNIEVEVQTKI